jgi:hypothetical protein
MEFLSSLHFDVKLLLVASALSLLAALVSGSKRKEHRYMAVFTVLMVVAGVRFKQENEQDLAADRAASDTAVTKVTRSVAPGAARAVSR